MSMNLEQSTKLASASKHTVDTVLGAGSLTAFAWWPFLQGSLAVFMAVGGAFLLVLRVLIAWREYKNLKGS